MPKKSTKPSAPVFEISQDESQWILFVREGREKNWKRRTGLIVGRPRVVLKRPAEILVIQVQWGNKWRLRKAVTEMKKLLQAIRNKYRRTADPGQIHFLSTDEQARYLREPPSQS